MATTKKQWLATTTGRIVGATAMVAASVGLINGGIDLYKTVLKIPDNVYDKTNSELFAKHFNKTPIVSQPVQIKASALSVEMLLQVYDGGDVFVRYGEFQQWLPFRKPKIAEASLFPHAYADVKRGDVLPETASAEPGGVKWQRVEQLNVPLVIDIDKLTKKSPPTTATAAFDRWSKAFLISETQQDRALLTPTTKTYERTFSADPGYRFTKVDLDLGSANKAQVHNVEIVDNGRSVRVQFSLTSGPMFDQYRGWIHATIKTEQEKDK